LRREGPRGGATKEERVDFLRQTIARNEGNVRAYDIKVQISLNVRRFKNALIATVVACPQLVAAFFAVGRCVF
jgi:hypothetical protein